MLNKFLQRSYELELIDRGDYTAAEYEGFIRELQLVNEWLGDSWTLKRTLFKNIEREKLKSFSVLDVGAGSGELLRVTADWARAKNFGLCGVGLELNERSAQAIDEESQKYPEILSLQGDAILLPFADDQFDYVICSLFTHHFVELQIINILREMSRVARRRVFVIDLHRHPVAYYFYITLGKLFLHNRLVRSDGALSILRGFKRRELYELGQRAELKELSVTRHFPFRLVLSARAGRSSALPEEMLSERAA